MNAPTSAGSSVTFNVIFTPGTVARQLPFALSLLQGRGVRLRLVSNACDPAEIELLRALGKSIEAVSSHDLPSIGPVEHGAALNHLFEAFPDPLFAFADSDVIAGGDFIGGLLPLASGQAAVFAAPPLWRTDEDMVNPPRKPFLGGARPMLHDGTFVGNTHCAVYDRTALEPAWRSSPKGFAVHHSYSVPRTLKASLKDRGWHFRSFDTGRVINLQLLLAGFELELRRVVPELHHVGGISMRDFRGLQAWARRMAQILRSGPDGRIRMIANGALERIYARAQRPPSHQPRMLRRRAVLSHVDEALDAILAGEPTPPAVRTDSAEVDRRVAALVATLEEQYPKGIARLRAATEAPPLDTRPEMRPSPAPPLS